MMTTADPAQALLQLINGYQMSQAIYVVATLGIPDRLRDGPLACEELAHLTNSHAGALYRVLRALAAVEILHEEGDRRFALSALGQGLRTDVAGSRGAWAQFVARPPLWQAWGHLLQSVRAGSNAFRQVHGMDVWEFRARHPEEGAIFDHAMREGSVRLARSILTACDFGRFSHIVDVGGGDGALLAHLLARHPQVRGTLFDRPHVIARAGAVLQEAGVDNRCEVIAGSFFETVPHGGDAYVLKFILHDWEDDPAIAILRACRRSMDRGAKLLIVERLLARPNEGAESKFSDLNMLVNAGGRERSRNEFEELLATAGYDLMTLAPVIGEIAVLEAC
jgi:hypothetical protein